jgi:CubicO group peptidase (beta-lactamase class C family)
VTGKRLGEVIDAEIWNRMGAENDALLLLNAKRIPIAHGGMVTTLRDLARFGLLLSQPNDSVLACRFLIVSFEQAGSASSEHNQQQPMRVVTALASRWADNFRVALFRDLLRLIK